MGLKERRRLAVVRPQRRSRSFRECRYARMVGTTARRRFLEAPCGSGALGGAAISKECRCAGMVGTTARRRRSLRRQVARTGLAEPHSSKAPLRGWVWYDGGTHVVPWNAAAGVHAFIEGARLRRGEL